MSPDSSETRIGRLERDFSALRQQVTGLSHEVETLAPVQMSVVRIETTMEQMKEQIVGLRDSIREDRNAAKLRGEQLAQEISDMRESQAEDQKASRRQLIAAALSIVTTLLVVGGGILTAILTQQ